jgi:hypothetical protein
MRSYNVLLEVLIRFVIVIVIVGFGGLLVSIVLIRSIGYLGVLPW